MFFYVLEVRKGSVLFRN